MRLKVFGSSLIIAGTCLGAGMIALPIAVAAIGFKAALAVSFAIWMLATWSALLIADICRLSPEFISLHGVVGSVLGRWGQVVVALTMLGLPYILCVAYISGATNYLHDVFPRLFHWQISFQSASLLITACCALVVIIGTYSVDLVSRVLVALKIGIMVILILLLLRYFSFSNLLATDQSHKIWLLALPLFYTSFGFHTTVPSIVCYLNRNPKYYRTAILVGGTIPLVVYLLWFGAVNGVLSHEALMKVRELGDPINKLLSSITLALHSKVVGVIANVFTILAILTSFLGVALGLFDYIAEIFCRQNTYFGRVQTGFITFFPPLLVTLVEPNLFLTALGFAAVVFVILSVYLPILMVLKIVSHERWCCYGLKNPVILVAAALVGAAIIAVQLLSVWGVLPKL